jgi:hypothetical protein
VSDIKNQLVRIARCEIGAMITCFVMLCHLEIEVLFIKRYPSVSK